MTDQSLENILVARGFATFTVTIRAGDGPTALRIANAAAERVRAEFQAITTDPAPPRWVSTEQDALARHLWAEFGTAAPMTTSFDQQDPSVRKWWMDQADHALRVVEEVPEAVETIPVTLVDPVAAKAKYDELAERLEVDDLRAALRRHIFDTCATWEMEFKAGPGRAVSVPDAAFAAAEFILSDDPAPVDCSDHKPVQHRDRKRPWCNRCGRAANGELIGTPR